MHDASAVCLAGAVAATEIFERSTDILASALDVAPNAAQMQEKVRAVAAHAASSADARAAVDALLRSKVIPEYKEYAMAKVAPIRNDWLGAAPSGNYGADYRLRTMVNLMGIWGNTAGEVIYFGAFHDPDGKPLNGGRSYVMHFPADGLPDAVVNAYWSIILVGVPDYRVVPNALKRYNFNNHSWLQKETDGSLKQERTLQMPPTSHTSSHGRLTASPNWSRAMSNGPDPEVKITEGYARLVARTAYFRAWPMVNTTTVGWPSISVPSRVS
jgi:hypothetical protein